ncbi:MAG: hypothetical protein M0P77_08420 [Firmicutes bacterium]|nr:hypothetical protein [Bacillota bacterium]
MDKNITTVVFWGALWGLVEATLGYVLHSMPLSVGWFFWFPLAFYFINKVYSSTGSLSSILYTSSIAAGIKLVNFFLPTTIDRVINPAMSILLEGLMVFIVFAIIEKKEGFFQSKYTIALTASIGWRVLYIIYILFMPTFFFTVSPMRAAKPFFKFFVTESFMNSLFIYVYLKVSERIGDAKLNVSKNEVNSKLFSLKDNPIIRISVSLTVLSLAIFAQWAL